MNQENPYAAPQAIGTQPMKSAAHPELLHRILFQERCGAGLFYLLGIVILGIACRGYLSIFRIVLFIGPTIQVVLCWLCLKLAIYPSLGPRLFFRLSGCALIGAPLFAFWQLSQSIDDGWNGFWKSIHAGYLVALQCALSSFLGIARLEARRLLEATNWFGLFMGMIATNQLFHFIPIQLPMIAKGLMSEASVMILVLAILNLMNLKYWAAQPIESVTTITL